MKLWVLSDLHIDRRKKTPKFENHPVHDVIVMAGDLCDSDFDPTNWLSSTFSPEELAKTVYVPGNHDVYGMAVDSVSPNRSRLEALGVRYLNGEIVEIDGQRFVGVDLWSDIDIPVRGEKLGDFKYMPGFTQKAWRDWHRGSVRWLGNVVQEKDVVITHHSPTLQGLAPEMIESPDRMVWSSSYATDLEHIIAWLKPAVWVFGHTHITKDISVGDTRVVSNALGRGAAPDFKPDMVIEI